MSRVVCEDWVTVSVTVLPPGWYNEFQEDPNIITPCPAVLLQELRLTEVYKDGTLVEREPHEAPFDTRVVFADDDGSGALVAAGEAANYLRTTLLADLKRGSR